MKTKIFAKSTWMMAFFAISALCVVSCADKFDFEDAHRDKSEENLQYNNRFEDIIGSIDPNHTWSAAQDMTAQAIVEIPGSHVLRIYSDDPLVKKAFLLHKVNLQGNSFTDLHFDLPASVKRICAVLDSAEVRKSQMIDVNPNGKLLIEFDKFTGSNSGTRAEEYSPRTESGYLFLADDDSKYKSSADVPTTDIYDIGEYSATWDGSKSVPNHENFYVPTDKSTINPHEGQCTVYFKDAGTYNINSFNFKENTKIYVLSGAHLIFNNNFSNTALNVTWAVEAGASLTFKGNYECGNDFYNRGTVTVEGNFTTSNKGRFINGASGELIVKGDGKVTNNVWPYDPTDIISQISNYGNATFNYLEVGAKYLNVGVTNVTTTTWLSSDRISWRNEGKFTTNIFKYVASSDDVINNCYLYIEEEFNASLAASTGAMTIGNGGSIVMGENGLFYVVDNMRIYLGGKSVIKAPTVKFKWGNSVYGYGVNYGVIDAGEISAYSYTQGNTVKYYGRLAVADNHFEHYMSGDVPNYEFLEGANFVSNITTTINIPESECNPGFNGGGNGGTESGGDDPDDPNDDPTDPTAPSDPEITVRTPSKTEIPYPYVIACEDLGNTANSDFDFNDIVFGISLEHFSDKTIAHIKPLAAGGTLEAYIMYKNKSGDFVRLPHPTNAEQNEIHRWITGNSNAPYTTMLNTLTNHVSSEVLDNIPEVTVEMPADVLMSQFSQYFGVQVIKKSTTLNGQQLQSTADEIFNRNGGEAPRMFCVEDYPQWEWMMEYQQISLGYTKFVQWAANQSTASTWYEDDDVAESPIIVKRSKQRTVTPQREEPTLNGYNVYVDGSAVTSIELKHGESKTIVVKGVYVTGSKTEEKTVSADLVIAGSAITVNGATITGNLPKVLDSEDYIFNKLGGDYNKSKEIKGAAPLEVKVAVESTLTRTYKSASQTSCKLYVKVDGETCQTITVNVQPEAVTDSNKTETSHPRVTWSGYSDVTSSNATCVTFKASTSGTLTAKQEGSNYTQEWTITVEGGGSAPVTLWENATGVRLQYYPQLEFDLADAVKDLTTSSIIRLHYTPESNTTQGISLGYKTNEWSYTTICDNSTKDESACTIDFVIASSEHVETIKTMKKVAISGDVYVINKISLIK